MLSFKPKLNNFENLECSVCFLEDETHVHVYQCKKIWKIKKQSDSNIPKYEEILWGDVTQKLKVARILKENMKIREQYKTWKTDIRKVGKNFLLRDLTGNILIDWLILLENSFINASN